MDIVGILLVLVALAACGWAIWFALKPSPYNEEYSNGYDDDKPGSWEYANTVYANTSVMVSVPEYVGGALTTTEVSSAKKVTKKKAPAKKPVAKKKAVKKTTKK